jgi:hypothetical protein
LSPGVVVVVATTDVDVVVVGAVVDVLDVGGAVLDVVVVVVAGPAPRVASTATEAPTTTTSTVRMDAIPCRRRTDRLCRPLVAICAFYRLPIPAMEMGPPPPA